MSSTVPARLSPQCRSRLEDWFRSPAGRCLLEAEQAQMERVLPNLFGYYVVQLGDPGGMDLLASSRIATRFRLHIDPHNGPPGDDRPVCLDEALPVATDSVDVMVLPHVLEFAADPHQVLREAGRVLIGEGHLVVLGFNPWSLWGLWRAALAWRDNPPWSGRFLGPSRVKDWLRLLGFDIEHGWCFHFRPPLRSAAMAARLGFMEKLGRYCWPYFGGAYMLVARKRVIPLTPIRARWKARRRLLSAGVAEPTTRSSHGPF